MTTKVELDMTHILSGTGCEADVFRKGARVYKLYRSLAADPNHASNAARRRRFEAELGAYRRIVADAPELRPHVPKCFGQVTVRELSGHRAPPAHLFDCCLELQFIAGRSEPKNSPSLDSLRETFRSRGICAEDATAIRPNDGSPVKFVDFKLIVPENDA